MQSSPYQRSKVFYVEQLSKSKVTCSCHTRYTTLERREDLKSKLDEEENPSAEVNKPKVIWGKGKAEKGKGRDVDLECQAGESASQQLFFINHEIGPGFMFFTS